jgi:membrane-bound inhibitor of C-type lysozyme
MRWHRATTGSAAILDWAAVTVAGFIAQASVASAQTFDSYRCADGTHFILAFYPNDKRAYLQIDGRAVTLKKALAVSGRRYSGGGVSLTMTATGALIRHVRRPVTVCELS